MREYDETLRQAAAISESSVYSYSHAMLKVVERYLHPLEQVILQEAPVLPDSQSYSKYADPAAPSLGRRATQH